MPKGVRLGGRKKGTPNKTTLAKALLAESLAGSGITPLQVMMQTMWKKWDAGDEDGACAIAEKAAAYMHPKLQSITQKNAEGEVFKTQVALAPEDKAYIRDSIQTKYS